MPLRVFVFVACFLRAAETMMARFEERALRDDEREGIDIMTANGPQLRYGRETIATPADAESHSAIRTVGELGAAPRHRRALELAAEIEQLLEISSIEGPPSARSYSVRIAQGMARSLTDQLKELIRHSAA